MDIISAMLGNPVISGLILAFVIFLYVRALLKQIELKKEMKKLKEHLHTKLELESEDNEKRKRELEKIKSERDNLRNMIQVLNQKPGKQELRQAQIYHRAVESMFEKSPGFAPVWQVTVKEIEEEMRKTEKGFMPFIKKITGSGGSSSNDSNKTNKTLEIEDGSK